jgi:D-amino-acid dehydrogenase
MKKVLRWMLRGDSPLYIRPTLNPAVIRWFLRFSARCNTRDMHQAASARNAMLNQSMTLYKQLIADEALDCEWEEKGVLFTCRTEPAMEEYGAINTLVEPYGEKATRLDRDDLLRLEPALRDDLAGAWYHETDTHLRPDRLMAEWKRALGDGVNIEEQCAVTDINPGAGTVTVDSVRGQFTAESMVLATGAWSPELGKRLGLKIPVQPGKGYSITMSRPAVCPAIPVLFCERSSVATPWASGYRLGGTMEFTGYREGLSPVRLEALRTAAREYLKDPEGEETVEEWFGFRPMTYDGIPYVGRAGACENVYVATGHNMIGISGAPATGHLIADLITNRDPIIDPALYTPQRVH